MKPAIGQRWYFNSPWIIRKYIAEVISVSPVRLKVVQLIDTEGYSLGTEVFPAFLTEEGPKDSRWFFLEGQYLSA
jgi:hypothetical protein